MNPIQWFPGHMAKAKREIKENIKLVDLVIELKDARIPFSSTNPMVDEIVGNKPRLILLNKSSLADPKITKEWMDYYKSINILSLDIDSINGYNIKNVVPYARLALKEVFEKRESKGISAEYSVNGFNTTASSSSSLSYKRLAKSSVLKINP